VLERLEWLDPLEATDDASLVVFPKLFAVSAGFFSSRCWEVLLHSSNSVVWFLPRGASFVAFSCWFCHGRIDLLSALDLMILFVCLFAELVDLMAKQQQCGEMNILPLCCSGTERPVGSCVV